MHEKLLERIKDKNVHNDCKNQYILQYLSKRSTLDGIKICIENCKSISTMRKITLMLHEICMQLQDSQAN